MNPHDFDEKYLVDLQKLAEKAAQKVSSWNGSNVWSGGSIPTVTHNPKTFVNPHTPQLEKVYGEQIIFSIDMELIEGKLDKMGPKDLMIFLQHIERLLILIQEKTIEKV